MKQRSFMSVNLCACQLNIWTADLQKALEGLSGRCNAQVNLILHSSSLPEWLACKQRSDVQAL